MNEEEWANRFVENLENESDRGCVLICSVFLDEQLSEILRKSFIDDEKKVNNLLGGEKHFDKPLSNFGPRILAAYCMGLIRKNEYIDLNIIRSIRNKFAHEIEGCDFNDQVVIDKINNLSPIRNGHMEQQFSEILEEEGELITRVRFEFTVAFISGALMHALENV